MDRKRLSDLLRQWAPSAGGRGTGSDNFRISGVSLDHADPKIAAPIARDYPYEAWAGKFAQALTNSEFVEVGIEAAKQKMRLHFLIAEQPPRYSVDSTLDMLEEINRQAPIGDLRCVAFHLTRVTARQLRRIRELGLIVTLSRLKPFVFINCPARFFHRTVGQANELSDGQIWLFSEDLLQRNG